MVTRFENGQVVTHDLYGDVQIKELAVVYDEDFDIEYETDTSTTPYCVGGTNPREEVTFEVKSNGDVRTEPVSDFINQIDVTVD